MRRRFLIESALMGVLLPLVALWIGQRASVVELDLSAYDSWLSFSSSAPSSDILIIGIDSRSLEELGPWPWRRDLHAQLLERLSTYAPRAVLFDLFLDEPAIDPDDDDRMAAAMGRVSTFLPMRRDDRGVKFGSIAGFRTPLPKFVRSAKGIGHAYASPDADGVVRRLFRSVGVDRELRPYVGCLFAPEGEPQVLGAPVRALLDGGTAQGPFGVSLAGPGGTYRTVPYVSALRGEIPAELLRGKILLVGAVTSSGLGDEVPVAGVGPQMRLAGVEMHANAIDALIHGRTIGIAQGWVGVVWTVAPIWIVLGSFLRFARGALVVAIAAALSCVAVSATALILVPFWLPPFAPVLGIGAAYLLWSWRRLNALLAYFRERAAALNAVPGGAFEVQPTIQVPTIDTVAGKVQDLDNAIERIWQMQTLLTEGMWHLPIAVLICQADGLIGQSNAEARSLLAPFDSDTTLDPLRGRNFLSLLKTLQTEKASAQSEMPPSHLSRDLAGEYTTPDGKIFRLRAAPLGSDRDLTRTWVIVLRDLTAERFAQRNRDRWLGFLSHDLRSPQVSILSLLALREQAGSPIDESRMVAGVRREAMRTLALAEAFMDMTEAESDRYEFSVTQAGAVALDAIDSVWAYAFEKGVSLTSSLSDRDLQIRADSALLTRALINLLNNAIRHSPGGSTVHLCLEGGGDGSREVVLAVRDEGIGISAERLASLLRNPHPTRHSIHAPTQASRSRGVGMAVVHAVVKRHDGWLDGHGAPGAGATFLVGLPLLRSDSG